MLDGRSRVDIDYLLSVDHVEGVLGELFIALDTLVLAAGAGFIAARLETLGGARVRALTRGAALRLRFRLGVV